MHLEAGRARVAVLGGAGFLGRHLCHELAAREVAHLRVVDIRRGRPDDLPPAAVFVEGCDVTDARQVRSAIRGCTAVVNLVGLVSYWRRDEARLFAINAAAAAAIARACGDEGIERFVHVSSSAALGFSDDPARPVDEGFRFDWTSPLAKPYMASKRDGEAAALRAEEWGVSTAVANPASMYGPGDRMNTARLFIAVQAGRVRVVPPGGNAVADVRDVARGLCLLLASECRGERFLFVGDNLSFVEIVAEVGRAVGASVRPARLPRWARGPLCSTLRWVEGALSPERMVAPDDLELGFLYRYASARKAAERLGWRPAFSFRETVRDEARDLRERGLLDGREPAPP